MSFSAPKKGGNALYQPLADINVTPLVDVMLVLLIVFMITAPMLAAGMKVNLPQAKTAVPLKPKAPVVISVGKDGAIQVNGGDVAKELVLDTVKAKLASADDDVIHIRGDRETPYGNIVAIMDLLATNGLVKIAILGDNRKQPAAPSPAPTEVPTGVSGTPGVPTPAPASPTTAPAMGAAQ